MLLKIIKVGKDLVLPIPDEVIQAMQLKEGAEVILSSDPEKNQFMVMSLDRPTDLGDINQEFAEQVTAFIRDYKPALDQLSNLDS